MIFLILFVDSDSIPVFKVYTKTSSGFFQSDDQKDKIHNNGIKPLLVKMRCRENDEPLPAIG
jgi:hypothetical protein